MKQRSTWIPVSMTYTFGGSVGVASLRSWPPTPAHSRWRERGAVRVLRCRTSSWHPISRWCCGRGRRLPSPHPWRPSRVGRGAL